MAPIIEEQISKIEQALDKHIERKPRSPTLLSLKWLVERVRKTSGVYEKVRSGDYHVDSKKVAEAIVEKKDK